MLFLAVLSLDKGFIDPWLPQISFFLPYVILVIGILLGLRFHQNRLALAVLLYIFSDKIWEFFGPKGVIFIGHEVTLLHTLSIYIPLNMLLLYIIKDRGLLTHHGLLRLFIILAQPLLIYLLFLKNIAISKFFTQKFISHPMLNTLGIPQVHLIFFGIVVLFFLILSLRFGKAIPRGFFWALLASGLALKGTYTGAETSFYFSIAGLIIILSMIETAYSMAYNDELTGLPARRSLNTTLQNLGNHYSIAMLDIDFFKKFNDKYGHDVGDQVLCMVASHINRVGGGGKPFRYGGEEFTVVFPGKSTKEAHPILEKLRESIANAQFNVRGKNRPKAAPKNRKRAKNSQTASVTISIGAASPGPKMAKPKEVMKAADKALYRAKKKGRNCTVS